ncbi:uncharacterized protein LOC122398431 [Colletes gigas]|uniref:uncharacterized protein LOC122398431 n=1 Tax=Colletes gigas TaxID=935657 RepID=UPI001C9ACB0A|nr:uncharacterized protein LOC122398431 [Colletes gigas]
MSMQPCGRDQRKMKQVIDQIRELANNLDYLRAEIGALKNNYLANDLNLPFDDRPERSGNGKTSILYKLKKCLRKIRSADLQKSRQSSTKSHEVCYPRKILDQSLLSSLRYNFRIGKKGEITRLKDDCNRTNEKFRQPFVKLSKDRSSIVSKYLENMENIPRWSELSCELDSYVEDPTFPNTYTLLPKSNFKTIPRTREVCSLNENKQFTNTSTQTVSSKVKRKRRNFNFRPNHSSLYFSKIKNAVITKKIIRNPSDREFTVCGKVSRVEDYPYVKKKFYECSCKTKKIKNAVETVGRETFEKGFSIQKCTNLSCISDDNMNENFTSEEELESSPSMPVSVDLEINVSNSSNEIEEFHPRRKPRTYTIKKTIQNDTNNWFDRFESVLYVGDTSDLTLSSQSLRN